MRKRMVVVAAAFAVACVTAMAISRRPVLFALSDFGDATGQPVFTVMNPFRDRAPERAAEAVLSRLQRGETAAALSLVAGGMSPETYMNEKKYPLRAWKLVRRTDDAAYVELVYRTSRSPSDRVVMPLFIHVQKANDHWQVTRLLVGY